MSEQLGMEEARREAIAVRETAKARESSMGVNSDNPHAESLEKASQNLQTLQSENPAMANSLIEVTNISSQINELLGETVANELLQYVQQKQQTPNNPSMITRDSNSGQPEIGDLVNDFLKKNASRELTLKIEQNPKFTEIIAEGVKRVLAFQSSAVQQ